MKYYKHYITANIYMKILTYLENSAANKFSIISNYFLAITRKSLGKFRTQRSQNI